MVEITYSYTEEKLIVPALNLRTDLCCNPARPPRLMKKFCHFINAEFASRILCIFVSVFAVYDASIHLANCGYKGALLIVQKCSWIQLSYTSQEVLSHSRRAIVYVALMITGSVLGVIYPDLLKIFLNSAPVLQDDDDTDEGAPPAVKDLVQEVRCGYEVGPYPKLTAFWNNSNLANKHWFVRVFSRNEKPFRAVKNFFAPQVYEPIPNKTSSSFFSTRKVEWLHADEIAAKITPASRKVDTVAQAFFFHATSKKALELILQSGNIEVRHQRAYRGAFVSTRPELEYGPCILAFKRTIERLSKLENGFTRNYAFWAGFSKSIPVTGNTLAYIMLNGNSERERQELEEQCTRWLGKKISVFLYNDVQKTIESISKLDLGVPSEWVNSGESFIRKAFRVGRLSLSRLFTSIPSRTTTRVRLWQRLQPV
ncbi:MAG: hypothetical protein JWO53_260 [Chlamydiia bacterium]|nr:hypothetical protein [Chlamydiia bacterium]